MEILALKEGLNQSLRNNLKPLEINTNSKEVIKMFHEGNSHCDVILDKCRLMLGELGRAPVHHCHREQNGVADNLAKKDAAKENLGRLQIFVVPPMHALDQVWADINETKYNRLVNSNNTQLGNRTSSFMAEPD